MGQAGDRGFTVCFRVFSYKTPREPSAASPIQSCDPIPMVPNPIRSHDPIPSPIQSLDPIPSPIWSRNPIPMVPNPIQSRDPILSPIQSREHQAKGGGAQNTPQMWVLAPQLPPHPISSPINPVASFDWAQLPRRAGPEV